MLHLCWLPLNSGCSGNTCKTHVRSNLGNVECRGMLRARGSSAGPRPWWKLPGPWATSAGTLALPFLSWMGGPAASLASPSARVKVQNPRVLGQDSAVRGRVPLCVERLPIHHVAIVHTEHRPTGTKRPNLSYWMNAAMSGSPGCRCGCQCL